MVTTPENDPDEAVWKALADGTRRAMLDLLREAPRSTGALAEAFPFSRFAAMKHLKVLVAAGLVSVERRAQTRWNHLNAVPIRRIYRRWIRPFDVDPADRLLRLQAVAEADPPSTSNPDAQRATTMSNETRFHAHESVLEVRIRAPKARVWSALTEDIGAWFPKSFCVGEAQRYTLEPRVGGRLFEDWGEGEGLLWGEVYCIRREQTLQLTGDIFPGWGGPARYHSTYELTEDGDHTVLRFSSTAFGALTEKAPGDLDSGWKLLLAEQLVAFAEKANLPEPAVEAR